MMSSLKMNEDLQTPAPVTPDVTSEKRHSLKTEIWETVRFILIAIVFIVIPIRLFIALPFIVSGASMDPTFASGQYLIVDELSYRLGEPARGDVAIFLPPKNTQEKCLSEIYRLIPFNACTYYIKRVIGLPGETVVVDEAGKITIKDSQNNVTLMVNEPYVKFSSPHSAKTTLKAGEYFLAGDNRANSTDSRSFGAVPRENIIGRAYLRMFPLKAVSFLPGEFKQ